MKYPIDNKIKQDTMKSVLLFFSSFNSGKLGALFLATSTIMLESQMQLLLLSALIVVDFITGVRKSLNLNAVSANPCKKAFWNILSSKGMRETWNKAYQYGFGILILIAVQVIFFGEETFEILNQTFSIVKAGMLVLCAIEIYSIFENLRREGSTTLLDKMEDTIIRIVKLFKGEKTKN